MLFINKYLTHYEKYNSSYTIFCTFGETRTLTPLTESGPKPDVSAFHHEGILLSSGRELNPRTRFCRPGPKPLDHLSLY